MKFQKGNAGRPVGSRNKRLEFLRSNDVKLQQKLIAMALSGDIGALKIVADRLWPRLRAEAPLISIDATSNDLAEQGRQVIGAGLRGEISTDVLKDLLASLYAQGKIVELAEFEDRIKALERYRELPPWEVDHKPARLLTEQKLLPMRGKRRRLRT